MRARLWIGVVATAAVSAGPAPQADVEALVGRNLAGISKRCMQPAECAVDAATIAYASNGVTWRWKPDDGVTWSDILFTGFDGSIQLAPRAGLVVTDADVAWFVVPYTATLRPAPEPDQISHIPSRAGGIAVKQRDGWHLAGIAYTDLISDHELFTERPHPDWFDLKELSTLDVKGDAHLARDFAGWFTTGFAAHAGPSARLLASGSSEAELARGADALKLATKWDKLGIRAWQIDAERVAGGKLAFVSATVLLPVDAKAGHAAPLVLFAVLVPDGQTWRWVSLQYGATDR